MPSVSRRSVLLAGAGAAALGVAAPAAARARSTPAASRVPVTRHEARVVVVGSGFGGGVTALRLARAGVPVLVLERGRWWPTGPNATTFPTLSTAP